MTEQISVGTVTVDVLPNLDEFKRLVDAAVPGLVITETTDTIRDSDGMVVRTVKTTTVGKG